MFDNIGGKIKSVAQVLCWIGIVASAISGIAMVFTVNFFVGLLVAAVGGAASWIGSLTMYGMGQLIEETTLNHAINQRILAHLEAGNAGKTAAEVRPFVVPAAHHDERGSQASRRAAIAAIAPTAGAEGWTCRKCGTRNIRGASTCRDCGEYK